MPYCLAAQITRTLNRRMPTPLPSGRHTPRPKQQSVALTVTGRMYTCARAWVLGFMVRVGADVWVCRCKYIWGAGI